MKRNIKGSVAGCLLVLLTIGVLVFHSNTSQAYSPKKKHQTSGPFVPGRVLVQFRPETLSLRSVDVIAEEGASDAGEIAGTGVHIVELPAGTAEQDFLEAFQSRPEVEFAELDRIVPPAGMVPNDPWYPNEWHLSSISAPDAWSTTTGSPSVSIAILDTGVDGTHPDLAQNMVPGWNIYNNNSDTSDVFGHGTAVAGTVAALSNNGSGVASIAWGCRLMPVRISDLNGNATYSAAASGLTWAADHGARVANISYIMTDSSTVTSAARYFQSKGGVVTISAGNYSTFDSSVDNPYVLTVSGITGSNVIWANSNTGNNIDLCAPYYVYTTIAGARYSGMVGTSFSAPIVAGVAALVISVNPSLTASQIQDILKQSADDLGPVGFDSTYGWGRVNAARAVSLAGGSPPPPVDTTPPTVSISSPTTGTTVSSTVSVQVAASDNVGVATVTLSVDGVLLASDTAAPYAFSWNTTTASNGSHTLTAQATDAAGNNASTSTVVNVSNASPDSTPPTVSITAPSNGVVVSGSVSVMVNATDNVGVVKVDLYVDGALVSTSTSSPFTNRWNSRKAASGAHTLLCKAYDAAGNIGVSATVTVYK